MLVLVNPGDRKAIYQNLDTAIEQPLWCRLIAGYIRDNGFDVAIVDMDAENLSIDDATDEILSYDPDLIAVIAYGHQPSASTQQMVPAGKLCTSIKNASKVPIVICGGHVSSLPKKTLEEEDVDYVATGEGVLTILGLLKKQPKIIIPGLEWRGGRNPPPPLMNTEDLHGYAWDLLPMDKYRSHEWQTEERQPYAAIYTSLQCPFKCQFCCINAPFGGSGYRTRSPADVVNEIHNLYSLYGVKTFKIIDEMFVLKPSHYLPICEGLAELNLDINIWAYARIDTVKNVDILYKAGIRWLALGIESGSEIVRDGSDKSLSQEDIFNIVKEIQDSGIKVMGNFIFGLPGDTHESMEETLKLAYDLNCDSANFYCAMAYPGSALYKMADPDKLPHNWSGYSQHSLDTTPYPTEHLTSEEIREFRDNAHAEYFGVEKLERAKLN